MSIQTLEMQLRNLDRQSQRLRKQLETTKKRQYKAIPAKYGFKSMEAFINALTPYAVGRRPGNGAAGAVRTRPASAITSTAARRGRSRYSEEQKAAVKAALQKGGITVPQLAKQSGVAEYTIIDWKKRWGLVKKRRKAAAKKK